MKKRKYLSTVIIMIVILSMIICSSLSVGAVTNQMNYKTVDEIRIMCYFQAVMGSVMTAIHRLFSAR